MFIKIIIIINFKKSYLFCVFNNPWVDLWDEDDDIIDSANADQYLISFHNSYNITSCFANGLRKCSKMVVYMEVGVKYIPSFKARADVSLGVRRNTY